MDKVIGMNGFNGTSAWLDPIAGWRAAVSYAEDAAQRTLLYTDIRRRRGNQYRAHLKEAVPNVLNFPCELVMSGADLPRPVNYGLVRIIPPEGTVVDPTKRPFIVVDPRAGHGPGIGGFKRDSEVGEILKAGHPCYFVGFLPDPVPGQTIEDVMRAEAAFVRKVAELHPESWGKPAVIGNCQAGWQVLMTAAVWPELFGPILVAGSPLSYWAGDNPMRYLGGLMGGSWGTALTSDLGAGRFDGAWLVQNFEDLNPANTLWSKQYNVYRDVDTEGPRYLQFEKYWGGHVFLGAEEMQYLVDNLFVGNKLATAELTTSDGVRIDLRNIRSPIIVFCSYGDNITPPAQALGWITDLYRDDAEIDAYDQTIVFATHKSIGHLGIFVSGSVGRKEHREFTANMDLIDLLPAGIYRADVKDCPPDVSSQDLLDGKYLMTLRGSGIDEVRDIVHPDPMSERRFAAAARVSEINLALYRSIWQPWVRALSSAHTARWLQLLQPVRLGFEWWSDRNPWAQGVAAVAKTVRTHRTKVAPENPFWQWQNAVSDAFVRTLDAWRDARDNLQALMFSSIYGSPLMQALAGQSLGDDAPARPHPGEAPEHLRYLEQEWQRREASMNEGGVYEAVLRALFHIAQARGEADGRHFRRVWCILYDRLSNELPDEAAFRDLVRTQALLAWRHPDAAIGAIPHLLAQSPAEDIRWGLGAIDELVAQSASLTPEEETRRQHVRALFSAALARSAAASQSASLAAPAVAHKKTAQKRRA